MYGLVWVLGMYGHDWPCMGMYGHVWSCLGIKGQDGLVLVCMVIYEHPFLCTLKKYPIYYYLVKSGLRYSQNTASKSS